MTEYSRRLVIACLRRVQVQMEAQERNCPHCDELVPLGLSPQVMAANHAGHRALTGAAA